MGCTDRWSIRHAGLLSHAEDFRAISGQFGHVEKHLRRICGVSRLFGVASPVVGGCAVWGPYSGYRKLSGETLKISIVLVCSSR